MPQDLVIQELQARLFESDEELKILKKKEEQITFLTREIKGLQSEKIILRETLQRALDRISFMEDERESLRSHIYGFQLTEKAAENDLRKLNGTIDELKKEISSYKSTIDDLMAAKKTSDQCLSELRQSASLAEESAQAKRRALEEQITALKKVNLKLEEALHLQSNNPIELSRNSNMVPNENGDQ